MVHTNTLLTLIIIIKYLWGPERHWQASTALGSRAGSVHLESFGKSTTPALYFVDISAGFDIALLWGTFESVYDDTKRAHQSFFVSFGTWVILENISCTFWNCDDVSEKSIFSLNTENLCYLES